jgi:hypothetical protein
VAAGVATGSVSLVGFGLDFGIEVLAALILAWRLAPVPQLPPVGPDERLRILPPVRLPRRPLDPGKAKPRATGKSPTTSQSAAICTAPTVTVPCAMSLLLPGRRLEHAGDAIDVGLSACDLTLVGAGEAVRQSGS